MYQGNCNVPTWGRDSEGNITGLVGPDNTNYKVIRYPIEVVYASQVPWILPQSGTISTNGALVLGSALPYAYKSGAWFYFPVAAVYSASPAGWYWVIMTDTTNGTVYSNYSANSLDTLYPPTTPTALSGTTGASYTGFTGNSSTLVNVVSPSLGGSLNVGDSLTVEVAFQHSASDASTNGKWYRAYGANSGTYLLTSPVTSGTGIGVWMTKTIQIAPNYFVARPESYGSSGPNMNLIASAELGGDNPTLTSQLSKQTATDYIILAYYRIVRYSASQ